MWNLLLGIIKAAVSDEQSELLHIQIVFSVMMLQMCFDLQQSAENKAAEGIFFFTANVSWASDGFHKKLSLPFILPGLRLLKLSRLKKIKNIL